MPEQSIFRESAIEHYRQRQEQAVLLQIVPPSGWVFCWAVLCLLIGALAFAWSIEVPVSVQSQGGIVESRANGQDGHEMIAVLFFSPDQLPDLHEGQSATVSIGANVSTVAGVVEHVEPTLISPSDARSLYNLQGELAQIITGPSITVTVLIGSTPSAQIYAGSLCQAQIHTGSQRVLSLLPGFKHIFGQ